jgi:hypothetical protein
MDLTRRSFFRLAPLAPFAAKLIVEAAAQAAVLIPTGRSTMIVGAGLDALDRATLRFIANSPRIVDGIFTQNPLFSLLLSGRPHAVFAGGSPAVDQYEWDEA